MRDAIYSVDDQGFPRLGFQTYGRENLISCASAMEPFLSFQSGMINTSGVKSDKTNHSQLTLFILALIEIIQHI